MIFKEMFRNLPELETKRVLLRRPSINDAEDMYEYTSNPAVTEYLRWDYHRSIETTINFIKHINTKRDEGTCIEWGAEFKENRKFIGMFGFVGYDDNSKCAELGYVLNDKYWHKGIASEIVSAIIEWAFNSNDLNKIYARHQADNIGSGRVMIKNGMIFEGLQREHFFKNGTFRDVKEYGLLRKEYNSPA